MPDLNLPPSGVVCPICGGSATRTAITAGGDELTPVDLCGAEVCKPKLEEHGPHAEGALEAVRAADREAHYWLGDDEMFDPGDFLDDLAEQGWRLVRSDAR